MERSFAAEVKQLALGDGQVLRGEGILAITHLLDVLADANEPLLKPMGVYLDASANEAAAAALLGASINYPMRGAVTWKSMVGTKCRRRRCAVGPGIEGDNGIEAAVVQAAGA